MNKEKQMKLEASGWKIGCVNEFLELSQEEAEFIALKLSLSRNLKERRQSLRMTQKVFAKMIHSSQSRVAKIETGDPAVSIDLLVKSLLALKTSKNEIAEMLPH
jgi:DNA-binding XRE family transcriptional regulator